MEITDKPELDEILSKNALTAAMFYAGWCPYSRRLKPMFENFTGDKKGFEFVSVKIDEDDNPLWDKYEIKAVPTLIFFRGSDIILRMDARPGRGLDQEDIDKALSSF